MRFAPEGLDDDGEWYGVWLTDLRTEDEVWVGSLKFPLVSGSTVVEEPLYSTIEIYGESSIRAIDIPEWYVTMKVPQGNGIGALSADPGYSGLRGTRIPNADIQCNRSDAACHFRVGGLTEQVGDGEYVRFP